MKKFLKYTLFIFLLFLLSLADVCLFVNSFLSFWILICFCIYKKSGFSIVLCALFGLLRDGLSYSLPYFSLIYLYISVGCVWCTEAFLGLDLKKIILISFLSNALYCSACFFINVVSYNGHFFINELVYSLLGTVFLSLLSPAVYFSFKRLKF